MLARRTSRWSILLAASLSCAIFAGACSKSESPAAGGTGATDATTATPATSASAESPSVKASPPEGADAAAVARPAATDTAKDGGGSATPTVAASGGAGGAPECGTKPLPDCPLQAWMKANMNPPAASGDGAGLAAALEKTVAFAPAGYANWASISKDGAKAARGGDIAAAKASCRSCHEQYKKKYQAEMRGRKI